MTAAVSPDLPEGSVEPPAPATRATATAAGRARPAETARPAARCHAPR